MASRAGRNGHVPCEKSVDNYASRGRPTECHTGRDRTAMYLSPTSKTKLAKGKMRRGTIHHHNCGCHGVRWEPVGCINCSKFRTGGRQSRRVLRSRQRDSLDSDSVIEGCVGFEDLAFARAFLRHRGLCRSACWLYL